MNKKQAKALRESWAKDNKSSDYIINLKKNAKERRENAAKAEEERAKRNLSTVEGGTIHDPLFLLAMVRMLARLK